MIWQACYDQASQARSPPGRPTEAKPCDRFHTYSPENRFTTSAETPNTFCLPAANTKRYLNHRSRLMRLLRLTAIKHDPKTVSAQQLINARLERFSSIAAKARLLM